MLFNKYFFRTIYDVGIIRIFGRLKQELKKIIYSFLPGRLNLLISNSFQKNPNFKKVLMNLKMDNFYIEKKNLNTKYLRFSFLNEEKLLNLPIKWNSSEFDHLWRFNLHYFDWAREVVENSQRGDGFKENFLYLNFIIEDWIDNNIPGYGDGWHSYTISLRIRNWILIFRTLPKLVNEKFLNSLWQQICWLFNNKESYIGGNHWIENLVSLIIGSLQFEGRRARNIYQYSIRNLKDELKKQILRDGGHFERSASYHLLILDRLVELGLVIENIEAERPIWLVEVILKMTKWAKAIKLDNGEYPKFNDNIDLNFNIDSIIYYALSYLEQNFIEEESIKNKLSIIYKKNIILKKNLVKNTNNPSLTKLLNTGWIIAKVNHNVELVFKVGKSCPKYLPAHGHSDLLSFDLFCKGVPLIVETGTSIYGYNKKRDYERSGQAHNILQLAPFIKNNAGLIDWIEPIEVWGNFRAARKANILKKVGRILKDGTIFMKGSNDANNRYGANYSRIIKLKKIDENDVLLEIIDEISCSKKMYWRQFWHLGPEQPKDFLLPLISELRKKYMFEENFIDSWVAINFGKTEKRKTLQLSGIIEPGTHKFNNKFVIKN